MKRRLRARLKSNEFGGEAKRIGECRGEEVFDIFQAMNTGHNGSIATVHASSPRDALKRLERMMGMVGFSRRACSPLEPICASNAVTASANFNTNRADLFTVPVMSMMIMFSVVISLIMVFYGV